MSLNHAFQSLKRGHQEFRLQPMWERQRRPLLHSSSSALGNLNFLLFFCAFLAELRISCASQVANVFFEDVDTKPTVRLNHSEHFRETPQGDEVRRLSSGLASVTSISFTDTDSRAFYLGGTVSWVAPADLTGIVQYHVRLNWDLSDTVVKTQLFDATLPMPCLCVLDPTTSWVFGAVEKRSADGTDLATYPADQYPAQWLFVLSAGASPVGQMAAGVPIQTVSEAAHMRLIDLQSTELPTSIQLETLIFTDQTNPANTGTHVEGILDWTTTGPDYPKVYEDWALADEFEVFLAEAGSLSGTLSRSLGTVTIGTAAGVTTWQLTIPETLLSGANALVVKAKNSVGQAPLSGAQSEVYLLPTTTSTSVTSTTTVLYSLAGTSVTFSDSDPTPGVISGSIGWQTPLSTAEITAYAIYMSYDTAGSQKRLITDSVVPPAASHSISGLTRETDDPSFPANWIIVYPMVQGSLGPVSVAAYVELYDDSGSAPSAPAFSSVDFTDEDAQGGYASGTVRWVLDGNADLAYTTEYVVYIAADQAGTGAVPFGDPVPVGTNEVTVIDAGPGSGVYIDANYHVMIYARNSHGSEAGYIGTPAVTSLLFNDVGSSTSTSATATETSTSTVSSTGTSLTTSTSLTISSTSVTTSSTTVTLTSMTTSSTTETSLTSNTLTTHTTTSSVSSTTTATFTTTSITTTSTSITGTTLTTTSTSLTGTTSTSSSVTTTSSSTSETETSTSHTTSSTSTISTSTQTTKTATTSSTSTSWTTSATWTGTTSTATTFTTSSSSTTSSTSTSTSTTSTSTTSMTLTSTTSVTSSTTRTATPEELAIAAAATALQAALSNSVAQEEAERQAAQALGRVYTVMLPYNESQTPAEQAAVAAAAADALAEQQSMTLEQQAVAAAQAALTSGTRSGMTQEEVAAAIVAASAAAVADSSGSAATLEDATTAGLAAAYIGQIAGMDAATQAVLAGQAATLAGGSSSGGGQTAGIRASGAAALAAAQRENANATVAELAALAAQAAADTAVALGLTPMQVAEAAAMVAAETAATLSATAAEQAAAAAASAAAIGLQRGLTPEESCFAGANGAGETAQRISATAGDAALVQAGAAGEAAAAAAASCGLSPEQQARAAAAAAQAAAQEASLSATDQISAAAAAASSAATLAGLDTTTTAEVVAAAHGAAAAGVAAAAGESLDAQVAAAAQAAFDEAMASGLLDTEQVLASSAAAAAAVFEDQVLMYDLPANCSDGTACTGNTCCSSGGTCPSAHPAFEDCGNDHALALAQQQIDAAAQWSGQLAGQSGMAADQQSDLSSLSAGEAAAEASRERGDNCTEQATAAGLAAAQIAANANVTAMRQAELAGAAAAAAAAESSAKNGQLVLSSNCSSTQGQIDAAARLAKLIGIQVGLTEPEIQAVVILAIREAEWEATHPSNRTTTGTSTSSTFTSTTTLPVVMCLDEPNCSSYMLHGQRCVANCSDLVYGYRTCIVTSSSTRYIGESFCIDENSPAVDNEEQDFVLGSVTILVNSTTPVTAEKAKEALANLMGINPAQIEELNASEVQTASGATTFAVDYVIKVWSLEEAQQADPTATEAQSTGTILGFSFALRAEGSQEQVAFTNLLEAQQVDVVSLASSVVVPTILTVTTITEKDPPGGGSESQIGTSSLGVAITVLVLLCCAGIFVFLVVCCSKIQKVRLIQAKAEKEVKDEVARVQEMQDNFDMVRTKISVMLPKLEPGHGPVVGRIQHVMEENDFEPVDDMLPDEREVVQVAHRGSFRDFTQDAFTLDIRDEALSPEDRNAVAQITGRRKSQTEQSLRRLGLDEAQLKDEIRPMDPTRSMTSVAVPDDLGGLEVPSIKPSPTVTNYMSFSQSRALEAGFDAG